MLKINNLHKNFDDYPVLTELNWEVPQKQIMGLVGINGSGKSTLLRCIAGVYDISSGSIQLNGQKMSSQKDQLTFISDEPFYFSRFSTKEMKNFYKSFYKSFDENEYMRLIKIFNFNEHKPIQQLSKGLKRQSALILGFSCKPKLLMMDESFDGLDPKVRLTLKKEMVKSVEDNDMSIIISTHNIREIEDIADSIALLQDGNIKLSRSLEDLQEEYHKIQIGYIDLPDPSIFENWDKLTMNLDGKVATIIFKGQVPIEEIKKTNPVLINPLSINMEEILVSEMEEKYE